MYGEVSALALGNHGAQMLKQIKDPLLASDPLVTEKFIAEFN